MNIIGKRIIYLVVFSLVMIGCNSTPSEVLSKEDMAQLLADIHIGESVVESERTKYYSDSLKKVVKQSILIKHNVTQAQLDTSFAWYGHNIEEYIAVYDRVIEILDDDINKLGANSTEKTNITYEGDSVDVWQKVRHYSINANSPTQFITFTLSKDHTWENGDNYTWRLKLINNISQLKWGIAADYSDGASEFTNSSISNEGWNEIKFIPDSTKTLNRVYGYLYATPRDAEIIYIDSISLVRNRSNQSLYRQRFTQRTFEYGKNNTHDKDHGINSTQEKDIEPINSTKKTSPEIVETPKNSGNNNHFKKERNESRIKMHEN